MTTTGDHSARSVVLSSARRSDIMRALRSGTVPDKGLEHLAVGLDRFERALAEELRECTTGRGMFKAVRGEYGAGKTFFSRWLGARAFELGMAVTEVQVSEVDTPLYRLETVYRRALEHLRTAEWDRGAFRQLVEKWFFDLEEEVLAADASLEETPAKLHERVAALLDARLVEISRDQPAFASALRAAHRARLENDPDTFEGLIAWLMGQPHVAASVKRKANLKSDLDHTGALAFLRGLLVLLKQTGRPGLLFVLDEVETIQRVRGDVREKSLNALRQFMDAISRGDYPGLYLVITGTPAFFDGAQGVRRLPPLADRLHVDFEAEARFDNPRAVQIRLLGFDDAKLFEAATRVRGLFPAQHPERIQAKVPDELLRGLIRQVSGQLGNRTGLVPRLFLKKLVDLLDKVDLHEDFDPTVHWQLRISPTEMTAEEAEAAGIQRSADDIVLDLSGGENGGSGS
jgi:hypothetical protein